MSELTFSHKDGDDVMNFDTSSATPSDFTLAEGNVMVGNSSGVGAALDASGDTKVLVGNGTTITSVALSGDVTMANTGAATVAALDLETATVTGIADTEIMIGDGAGSAAFAALSGDVTMASTGAVTIGSEKVTNAMQKVPKVVIYTYDSFNFSHFKYLRSIKAL